MVKKQSKTPLILGLIGAIGFILFGIAYLGLIIFVFEDDTFGSLIPICFVCLALGIIGCLFSALCQKNERAATMLIVIGVITSVLFFGIFYIVAGVKGRKYIRANAAASSEVVENEHSAAQSQSTVNSNAAVQSEVAPVVEAAEPQTKEDHGEIDINTEKRPSGRRFGGKWYPSKGWFSENGIPVKEIPVDKRTLKSMDDEQKYVVALATFSIVKLKSIFIILTFIASLIVGFVASAKAGGDDNQFWGYVFTVLILLFGVGFIVVKPAKLIDGFTIVNGTFKDRIGLPWYWDLVFFIASMIGTLWSFFPSVILTLFDMTRREKMLSIPRVGVPQNIGMDDMIEVYSAYERACSIDDAFNQSAAASAKREYDRKQNELDSVKSKVSNSDLSASTKNEIIKEADRVKQENEKKYNDSIKPNL